MKVQFVGRIFPQHRRLSYDQPYQAQWPWPDGSCLVTFELRITDGNVTIDCVIPSKEPQYIRELRNQALAFARLAVDQFCFATGCGMTVILEDFIDEAGKHDPILLCLPDLGAHCTVLSLMDGKVHGFVEVAKILSSEAQASIALNDLVTTVSQPDLLEVNCGRMVDALRRCIAPDVEPTTGWPIFNGALNLGETFTKFITSRSLNPRHGRRVNLPMADREELWRRSWEIMNRFIEYRKRGNTLPVSDFPTLSA